MLWYIVAAKSDFAAFLQKGGGEQIYFSYGPRALGRQPNEADLEPVDEMVALSQIIKGGYINHEPPLVVERLEDWPDIALQHDRPLRPIEFY